jgi:hypothetical protein
VVMTESCGSCAVCGRREANGTRMSKVVVEGRALVLCRAHAATVAEAMPETFDELRALFVGMVVDPTWAAAMERRSPLDRRFDEDRRTFPPRPEGRRASAGRRASDPRD